MRVYLASTPKELEPFQAAADDVVRELGMEPVRRDPAGIPGFKPVAACARQVAAADLVLTVLGHRRGPVPAPELGGDGLQPWSYWETRAAFERGRPVAVLMADDAWRRELREDDPNARAVMRDLRGELGRLAVCFDGDAEDDFRALVRSQLEEQERRWSTTGDEPDLRLRDWPPPALPERPYPVLLPYTHPELMAGRDRELAELRRLLTRPTPILGLHAPSGTGKSSLLYGGLVPSLRAEGRPAALDRHPREPGIARRLLGDLLDAEFELDGAYAFVDRLCAVQRLAGTPAVLILDQFEDLLSDPADRGDVRRVRAVVGTLLAASIQRLPGLQAPPCRWLLAYRQEFHGEVFQWLADVLRDAREEGLPIAESLPHDLSSPDRFQAWPLPVLGTPASGTEDRTEAASRIFLAALEKPLALTGDGGEQLYPWHFGDNGAARLARAFGEARAARPSAPLAPELQVVLAHLLEEAWDTAADDDVASNRVRKIDVPEDPGELIDRALEEHLRRALDAAFPASRGAPARIGGRRTAGMRGADADNADVNVRRTRALLALRELADPRGRRDEGRPAEALARAIGPEGREVLKKLATPQTRVVLFERHGDALVYVLSHDRMAEVVVRLVDDAGAYAGLGVDAELLRLRRFVALQGELFATGETAQATEVPADHFAAIERHADALLWNDAARRWWRACQERRRLDRRQGTIRRSVAGTIFMLLALAVGAWTDRYFKRQALLETVAEGAPEAAFQALARLSTEGVDSERLVARVRERAMPFDVLERGLAGVDEKQRGAAVVQVAELLLPLIAEMPEDPVRIAPTVWALDFFAMPAPALEDRARALRDEVLEPLRKRRPPPALADSETPAPEAVRWADIPGGRFWMGVGPDEERDADPLEEWPRHQVQISPFRMMTREVSTAELRRLWPDHRNVGSSLPPEVEADLPAGSVTWYEAYTYAAWLGGRLPTEAEWDYAARAGCAHQYCKGDGSAATRSEVAWWPGNSVDPKSGDPGPRPVARLAANPWGLHDVYGNVFEWTANWLGPYSAAAEIDPPGPASPSPALASRVFRGGSVSTPTEYTVPSRRVAIAPEGRLPFIGLRVAFPDTGSASNASD